MVVLEMYAPESAATKRNSCWSVKDLAELRQRLQAVEVYSVEIARPLRSLLNQPEVSPADHADVLNECGPDALFYEDAIDLLDNGMATAVEGGAWIGIFESVADLRAAIDELDKGRLLPAPKMPVGALKAEVIAVLDRALASGQLN